MHVNFFTEDNSQMSAYSTRNPPPRKHYGVFNFLFDVILIAITGGFWFVWVFVREMRKR